MSAENNSARVPLHLQKGMTALIARTEFVARRPPAQFESEYRNASLQQGRLDGNTALRRNPDGTLDVSYVGIKVLEAISRLREAGNVASLNDLERCMLSLITPGVSFIDSGLMQTMVRLSESERYAVSNWVTRKLKASSNWNAGRGGGNPPGDFEDAYKSLLSSTDGLDDLLKAKVSKADADEYDSDDYTEQEEEDEDADMTKKSVGCADLSKSLDELDELLG